MNKNEIIIPHLCPPEHKTRCRFFLRAGSKNPVVNLRDFLFVDQSAKGHAGLHGNTI